ncbi:GNAT family N-acetyltransferase [Flavobacterium sp.]|uniref:GNAT family N-acetyltransferase n=1 Tax=Flavobacterium sp. TaxID=239 RepID=UPI002623B2A1|nr:GNAT family N-acetyltransferase [Flavobacterium sp.]
MDYKIRECKADDLDTLIVLCAKHADYERATYEARGKKEKLDAALFSDNKKLYGIVAEVAGEVIGYATYTFDFSTWEAQKFIYLDCLYLEEAYRNFGIGHALMEKVIEIGQTENCINMQWQTPDFNEKAIRFYKRIGGIGKEKVRFTLPL